MGQSFDCPNRDLRKGQITNVHVDLHQTWLESPVY